jgi:uncharacterized protein with WD repeat
LLAQKWTDTGVTWSPMGTYLATFHRQGLAIWGTPSWKRYARVLHRSRRLAFALVRNLDTLPPAPLLPAARLARFSHNGVRRIDFSPLETYIVTWSPDAKSSAKDPSSIIIWDIKTGQTPPGARGPRVPARTAKPLLQASGSAGSPTLSRARRGRSSSGATTIASLPASPRTPSPSTRQR